MADPRWLPLESNPDVMNQYIKELGVDTSKWSFVDVYGLDEALLMMVPKPVCSLLLLFPITENYEAFCKKEEKRIRDEGQSVSDNVYFMKQTVGNACGTVGIIHSIANNLDEQIRLSDGPLKTFLEETKSCTPDEKAKKLGENEAITTCHSASAMEGQTKAPSVDDKVLLHFIAFVEREGHVYELDGRKPFPVKHGKTTKETFLEDCAGVCKDFMQRDPTLLQFNMIALALTDS